jgi:hypothetical protein
MKPFAIWLGLTLLVFGGFSAGYHVHLNRNPRRIAVAVDSSFPMRDAWGRVRGRLEEITSARYTRFALLTEKGRVHSWSDRVDIGKVSPYAPRDFSNLADAASVPEIAEADERVLVTNAPTDQTDPLQGEGWRIVRPNG